MKLIIFLAIVAILFVILVGLAFKAHEKRAVDTEVWSCEQDWAKKYADLNVKYQKTDFALSELEFICK